MVWMMTRKAAYGCDVPTGRTMSSDLITSRDNMKRSLDRCVREFNYAIVDEVDSILIDEARTPLIIFRPCRGRQTNITRSTVSSIK